MPSTLSSHRRLPRAKSQAVARPFHADGARPYVVTGVVSVPAITVTCPGLPPGFLVSTPFCRLRTGGSVSAGAPRAVISPRSRRGIVALHRENGKIIRGTRYGQRVAMGWPRSYAANTSPRPVRRSAAAPVSHAAQRPRPTTVTEVGAPASRLRGSRSPGADDQRVHFVSRRSRS